MIRASIDIGSNSVLLLAAEIDPKSGKISNELLNLSHITSLGKDLDKMKRFHPDSMMATYEALKNYKEELSKINIQPAAVLVTATEASRVALNASEFYEKIKREIGFSVTLISSEGEAHYTALGVISGISSTEDELVIMDIGGASTELIRIQLRPFKIISTISLAVGSVRATDWRNEQVFDERISTLLNKDFSTYVTKSLICVAGSMTALATMFLGEPVYDDKKIDGFTIAFNSFKEFSAALQKTNVANLLLLFPHLGKRAPMVAAGAIVAELIGEKLKIENMKISTRGLRYGTLIQGEIDAQFTIG
jgi:exopolyphosphatase/guanosine-5'-triphosphate,3'-diphosphate pyrophosphatase